MNLQALLYIHYRDNILLINWKKYGHWCCIGGSVGENGDSLYDVGINAAKNLCGITPTTLRLRGIFNFNCKICDNDSSISYVFHAETKNPTITKCKELNNAKWVPVNKALNYKLFPNSERYLLNTYLSSNKFFNLSLEYTNEGICKIIRTSE